jgi:phage shock protein A
MWLLRSREKALGSVRARTLYSLDAEDFAMSKNDPEEFGLDKVLSWVENLSPAELERLEQTIQKKVWRRRIRKLGAIPENASATMQRFIERVESGNIDEDIKATVDRTWIFLLEQFMLLSEMSDTGPRSSGTDWRDIFAGVRSDDPIREMEQVYQDLQSNLIQIRQAVAQSIATEKHLEQQLQKNQEQANTWQTRAAMAVTQGNDALSQQAMKRKQHYESAAAGLGSQLQNHREVVLTLRERLTEIEHEVQKTYTKKVVLGARYKAAEAAKRANDILSKSSSHSANSVMERLEKAVAEREAQAGASVLADDETIPELDTEQLLRQTVNALERCTAVIESMEKKVAQCEAQVSAQCEARHSDKVDGGRPEV